MPSDDFHLFILFSAACFIMFSCGIIAGAVLGKMR